MRRKFRDMFRKEAAPRPVYLVYDDITTDIFITERKDGRVTFTSAYLFPKLHSQIYHIFFEQASPKWHSFISTNWNMPAPERWKLNHIILNTIDFEEPISDNVSVRVSYTQKSSSYDEQYCLEISHEDNARIRINRIHSWKECMVLLTSMLAIVSFEKNRADERELARINEIYPKNAVD